MQFCCKNTTFKSQSVKKCGIRLLHLYVLAPILFLISGLNNCFLSLRSNIHLSTLVLCATLLMGISCKKTVETEPLLYSVDKTLEPFIENFIKEAAERGLVIPKENLIAISTKVDLADKVCGLCTQTRGNTQKQRTVQINTNEKCWQDQPSQNREALVFHELGHCLLGRINHKNDLFADGSPKSIMVANNLELYNPCIYAIDDNASCNKTQRRKYYIDELFNPNTPAPFWAKF